MKISVDLSVCAGHARCCALAPEIYDTDEAEGKCVVLHLDPSPDLHASATRGAKGCPERAIRLTDEERGTILWPHLAAKA